MSLGIPYMGSKRKIAPEILKLITQRHSGCTDFYDLFGGGGSISFNAIKSYKINVHYNELNSHIYHLVNYLKSNKDLEPKFYEWVTRAEFHKQCGRTDADWYSGFVMSCWSFGSSQRCYIYGAEIEDLKRLAHEFVVNGCLDSMGKLNVDIPSLLDIKDVQRRRIVFCDYVKNIPLVEHLARFQQLERIQNLQNLQNLQTSNLSYQDVIITGEYPVIYCDIPYRGTGKYKEGGFNHDAFYKWANDCKHPVYISEYDAPFTEIHALTHRSSLSPTNNKKKTIEKIYYNDKGIAHQTTLF